MSEPTENAGPAAEGGPPEGQGGGGATTPGRPGNPQSSCDANGGDPVGGGDAAEGSSSSQSGGQRHNLQTLDDVMRDPSSTLPDVVVLDSLPDGSDRKDVLDPKEDLWLSTSDGYVLRHERPFRLFFFLFSLSLLSLKSLRRVLAKYLHNHLNK